MQLTWHVKEKENQSSLLGAVACSLVVVVTAFLALNTYNTDKIISVLYLIVGVLAVGVGYYIFSSNLAKKRHYMQALNFSFKEGYFIYTHPEYMLVFAPSAIVKIKESVKKDKVTLIFDLDMTNVEVVGDISIKTGLIMCMKKDDYLLFKDFYEQGE